jgi:hypothetical protein
MGYLGARHVHIAALLHDAGGARLDKVRHEIFRDPSVVLANERAGLVATAVAGAPMAVAKEVIELLLDRDKEVVMEEYFLGRGHLSLGDAQSNAIVLVDGEHLASPEPELRGLQLGFGMMEDIPDAVEHGLRDEGLALSPRSQRLDVACLDLLVLRVGRKSRAFDDRGEGGGGGKAVVTVSIPVEGQQSANRVRHRQKNAIV